jgi:hypothetical protein
MHRVDNVCTSKQQKLLKSANSRLRAHDCRLNVYQNTTTMTKSACLSDAIFSEGTLRELSKVSAEEAGLLYARWGGYSREPEPLHFYKQDEKLPPKNGY